MMGVSNIRVLRVDDLDTNLLVPLAEESASEGFRHLGRLINEYGFGCSYSFP